MQWTTIFGIVWAAAIVGIVLNSIDIKSYSKFSAVCYLVMGWTIVLAWNAASYLASKGGMVFLASGGVCYTLGAVFYYAFKKKI